MKIYLKLLLTAIFWGGTFVAGRLVTQNVGPYSIAFLRFTIASIWGNFTFSAVYYVG